MAASIATEWNIVHVRLASMKSDDPRRLGLVGELDELVAEYVRLVDDAIAMNPRRFDPAGHWRPRRIQ